MTAPSDYPFGERLKRARLQRKIAVRTLAERAGVAYRQIYRYESNDALPNMEAAIALARTLGCSLDWLCDLGGDAA